MQILTTYSHLLCHYRLILVCFWPLLPWLLLFSFPLIGGAALLAEEGAEKWRVDVVNHCRG